MKRALTTVLIAGCFGCTAIAAPSPVRWVASVPSVPQPSKKDVLAKLKAIQDQQILESTDLENAIRRQLNETVQFDASGEDAGIATRRTNLVTKKIDELNKRRAELNSRREIVDRTIFQVDSKWDGKAKLQDFLSQVFLEMASNDLSDGRDNRLWKEFTYLSMVMREVPEPNDDLVSIFQGYLRFSSVLDPKTPAEFIASRNYTNGLDSQAAKTASRTDAADGVHAEPPGPGAKPNEPIVIKTTVAKDLKLDPNLTPEQTAKAAAASPAAQAESAHALAAQQSAEPQVAPQTAKPIQIVLPSSAPAKPSAAAVAGQAHTASPSATMSQAIQSASPTEASAAAQNAANASPTLGTSSGTTQAPTNPTPAHIE